MNVKTEILKILQDCSRDVDFLNGTIQHMVDKDKASDQIALWIEMYAAARCAQLLINLSEEVGPKRKVPDFPSGGVVSGPAVVGDSGRPEHVLSDEQLERISSAFNVPNIILRSDMPGHRLNRDKNEG